MSTATGSRQRYGAAALAVTAMISVQTGAAVSTWLFDSAGPTGTAWLRLAWGAIFLLIWARPRLTRYSAGDLGSALALGVVSATLTICYFQAIARIPLGTASALEYLGPLTVAVVGLRRRIDVLWPVAAGGGVLLLTQPWTSSMDPVGVAFALGAGAALGLYVVLTQRVGDRFAGMDGLALAVTVAAICAGVLGVPEAMPALSVEVLLGSAVVALLLPVLPYALEMMALRRLTSSAFSTLMSVEPAAALLIGLALLIQVPGPGELAGIALVVLAGIGAVRSGHRQHHPDPEPTRDGVNTG
ncbi:MAG TPA: EamA family transporter [Pseudonocardiaceae bacterium]